MLEIVIQKSLGTKWATHMSRPKVKFMEVLPITPNELLYKFYHKLKNYQLKN
jgi:hypothetical protein